MSEVLEFLKGGQEKWNNWRERGNNHPVLQGIAFKSEDFTGFNFRQTGFLKCSFFDCRFNECNLDSAVVTDCEFVISSLKNATGSLGLHTSTLKNCDLSGVNFSEGKVISTHFEDCVFSDAIFRGTKLSGSNFSSADLSGVVFDNAECNGAVFSSVDFFGAGLEDASFQWTDLTSASLIGCRVNGLTVLSKAKVKETKIDRLTLESLDN
jgi:uncharacterized protein YjbI with pentapeptide repeats